MYSSNREKHINWYNEGEPLNKQEILTKKKKNKERINE
jgi:hypothetical protein